MNDVVRLRSPLSQRELSERLTREVDSVPSRARALLSLNASYWRGTAEVCGTVTATGFDLASRAGPGFSLRARGEFMEVNSGTEVVVTFRRPPLVLGWFGSLLGRRYAADREKILTFLTRSARVREGDVVRVDSR